MDVVIMTLWLKRVTSISVQTW